MRCIVDTNILIDLHNGAVLSLLFQLNLKVCAPDVLLDEMTDPAKDALLQMGVERVTLSPDQLFEIAEMHTTDGRLSLSDCAAFVTARDAKLTLLTGDQRLRMRAEEDAILVHGVLWVLDQIEAAGLLTGPDLAISLRKMLVDGARLPVNECDTRLKRWE